MRTTRQEVIQWGQDFLNEIGIGSICSICISKGGSCCFACKHLEDGVGCRSQNTGCTSWLCGYLLFIFHEADLLLNWTEFWEQIPGKEFRKDSTPDEVEIEQWFEMRDLRSLTTLFSEDLRELMEDDKHYYSIKLNDILYRYITAAYATPVDRNAFKRLDRILQRLTKGFHRYHTFKASRVELP